ncbi:anthocyanidin 3-O-glucoside 6''-O-acyltransferase-like [Zingiber officinale]|uniref:anthocyanidin 3-O-glucoside 6''-O-acyltransferase-like n=1 Tax=Zingiber officinale TaxID=94328 RepID=UPI001C4B3B03|nr:anthocyanidin 3-O-glucoside 6''-O-acyltransferase-like [Zingiber officinale]
MPPMAKPPELLVLERSRVAPPPGSVGETTLPLTFFDAIWLRGGSVERVFFYRLPHSTSYFVTSILPNLKSSLSLVLPHFYPLAGNIRRSPRDPDGNQYEIHYAEGDGVTLTVAEYDDDFDQLSGSQARDLNSILPLLPQLRHRGAGEGFAAMALQVTIFPDRGVAIGVSIHHAACGGSSSTQFMLSWASTYALSEDTVVGEPPVFDRSLVSDPRGLYSIFYGNYDESDKWMDYPVLSDAVLASFTLKKDQIQRLKELVSISRCSTIVVTYAYIWSCLTKSLEIHKDGDDDDGDGDRMTHLLFPVDCKARLRPPLPETYFGNCLAPCFVDLKVSELIGEEGVVVAARAIADAIKVFVEDPLREAETWLASVESIVNEQPLTVAGSPKFHVYGTDFGWGRPKKVEITSIARTGAVSVAESRDEDGGVEIGVVLPKPDMEQFEMQFNMQWPQQLEF